MYGATTYVEAFTFAIVTQMTIGARSACLRSACLHLPACFCCPQPLYDCATPLLVSSNKLLTSA